MATKTFFLNCAKTKTTGSILFFASKEMYPIVRQLKKRKKKKKVKKAQAKVVKYAKKNVGSLATPWLLKC